MCSIFGLFARKRLLRQLPYHTLKAGLTWEEHKVLLHRMSVDDRFGKRPVIGVQIRVSHARNPVFEMDHLDVTWYENVPSSSLKPLRVKDDTIKPGYQYHLRFRELRIGNTASN